MKWVKKHRFTTFVIIIYSVLVVLLFFVYKIFFSANGNPVYGDRLDGIEAVVITEQQYEKIKEEMEDGTNISKISTNLSGKTVNVVITVGDNVTKDQAKGFGKKVLDYFDANQVAFYDFQVFIKKDNKELNDFPIIGYKHYKNSDFSWTKDRQVSE